MNTTWSRLLSDPQLDRSLRFWHEAFLIESSHASIASVAYAAVIESLADTEWGRSVAPPKPGEEGSHAKFRRLMNVYASENERRVLHEWYGRRSSTAHGARAHGVEPFPGALFDLGNPQIKGEVGNADSSDEAASFSLRFMSMARAITARVLEASLRGAD